MRSELEYAKKMVLIAKLFRSELISEKEYEKIRRKLLERFNNTSLYRFGY